MTIEFAGAEVGDDVAVELGGGTHEGVGAEAAGQRVAAEATGQQVVAATARQQVRGSVAVKLVVEVGAGAVDRFGAGQGQILEAESQREADARQHRVDIACKARRLDLEQVACVVDDIGVAAAAADQVIGAGAAVEIVVAGLAAEEIVPRIADDHIVERIAEPDQVQAADKGQILDVRAKGVGDVGGDAVDPGSGKLDHLVDTAERIAAVDFSRDALNQILVVARAAVENVTAAAAAQHVIAGEAEQDVVAGASSHLIGAGQQLPKQPIEVVALREGGELVDSDGDVRHGENRHAVAGEGQAGDRAGGRKAVHISGELPGQGQPLGHGAVHVDDDKLGGGCSDDVAKFEKVRQRPVGHEILHVERRTGDQSRHLASVPIFGEIKGEVAASLLPGGDACQPTDKQ